MATDRVSQTRDYGFSAWGFQTRGWGRRPSDALTHTQTEGMDPFPSRPGPRPLAGPLALCGHIEHRGEGGFLRPPPAPQPYGGGWRRGGRPPPAPSSPGGGAPVRAGRAGRTRARGRGRAEGGPRAGPKPHPRGRGLAPGSVRKRKSAARGGAGARRAGAGPRRAPRGPPWPRTSWPAS